MITPSLHACRSTLEDPVLRFGEYFPSSNRRLSRISINSRLGLLRTDTGAVHVVDCVLYHN